MSSLPSRSWVWSYLPRFPLLSFPISAFSKSQRKDASSSSSPPAEINSLVAARALEKALPPSTLKPRCHVREPQVTEEVGKYFIQHWPFPDKHAIQKFHAAGFSRVTCCYFPEAFDDRITFAAQLLTLLFLIDGTFLRFKICVGASRLKIPRPTRRHVLRRRQGLQRQTCTNQSRPPFA